MEARIGRGRRPDIQITHGGKHVHVFFNPGRNGEPAHRAVCSYFDQEGDRKPVKKVTGEGVTQADALLAGVGIAAFNTARENGVVPRVVRTAPVFE